jgi:diamine N-acetyltransferase
MKIERGATRLRPWHDADVPLLMRLRNDIPLQAQLLARVRGSDETQVRRWLYERTALPRRVFLVIANAATDAPLGFVQVSDLDPLDRRGELGIGLVAEAQGVGHGARALALLLENMRSARGLRKMSLRVRSDNTRAIRCYERAGFVRCGLLRSHVHFEGVWRDVVMMECMLEASGC